MNDTNNIGIVDDSIKSTAFSGNTYTCNTCKCVFSTNVTATRCIMCNSTSLNNNEVTLANANFVPFSRTISNALEDYKYKTKNILIPKVFKDKKTLRNIKKVYLPAYLVDANVKGPIKFFGADKIGNGEVRKYELEYDSNFDFNNVLINGYSKIKDDIFNNICNYQYDKIVPFNDTLLNDSYSISYDLVPLEVSNKINNRVMRHCLNEIRGNIPHSLKKLHKNEMDVQINNNNKLYVPVYITNIRYKGKNHIYIMNGQTGNSHIELEYSIVSIIIFSIVLFAIIFTCAFLFAYFF